MEQRSSAANRQESAAYFDGIQLFKEEFGTSYTYHPETGKIISVEDLQNQVTTYEYDANGNLTAILQDNQAKMTYEYDDYHNVTKATSAEGIVYEFEYDAWGNNTSVSIVYNGTKITSTAAYSADGNILLSTTDALAKTTYYGYNVNTNVLEWVQYPNDTAATQTEYTYDDDNRLTREDITMGVTGFEGITSTYTYDEFGRLCATNSYYGDYDGIDKDFFFGSAGSGKTSGQVTNYQADTPNYIVNFDYTYDDNGNIQSATCGTALYSYEYDSANQLIRENNQAAGKTWVWTYDDAGNILSRTEYAYTTGTLGTPVDTVVYTYGDSSWGDLLTAFDGKTITYDGIGNPLTYDGWTFTWEHGRELSAMSKDGTTWQFTYDVNGMRMQRTNGSSTYKYVYNGSQLSQMTVGNNTLSFAYDATGAPVVLVWNGVPYYYVTTLQGDVLIIMDLDGEVVVSYEYDAWGNILSTTGSMATTIGAYNPLRYRGYVYDHETGLYYLQSRYYNPEWGRFINADVFVSTGQGLLGNNMFAYALNNSVNRVDPNGCISYDMIESGDPNNDSTPLNDVARIGSGCISKGTFRVKLVNLTGSSPSNCDAHHMLPQKFTNEFKSLGIDNQDPMHGAWVDSNSHRRFSYEYNQWWSAFFSIDGVTAADAFALAEFLAGLFGYTLNY